MSFAKKPEILAPAGTLDAIEKVLEAGADAVYVSGKSLNMRQHRASYNLTDAEIGEAVKLVHGRDKKLYFTLNSLIVDAQMREVRETLAMLGGLNPDALIVQDLAVASLAREICVQIPLHASTMMNVHNVETALTLKMMGFSRIIPSRDIPLHAIRRISEQSGLEMECFVHGDMCISQSSQCYLSGILFGESANCGRCMKPCRWNWKLALLRGKAELAEDVEGYLLARKDMCLLPHIPELVQNDIASLKIEGRMRTAEFLAPVVTLYRKAVDAYFEDPASYKTNAADMQTLFSQRVRELTTAHSFGNPGADGVDISGKREPRFFSHAAPVPVLTANRDIQPGSNQKDVELIVHVSSVAGAEAALEGGANAVYFCGDGFHLHGGLVSLSSLTDFVHKASQNGARLGMVMPRICDERDMNEWRQRLPQLAELGNLTIGVSNLGGLQLARDYRFRDIFTDYGLNVTNSVAADELSTLGASRLTASVELTYAHLTEFTEKARMPIEVIGQGPVCGMLLEHCVVASAAGENPQELCSMHCRQGAYALEDTGAHRHPLECDRRCRNHVFTPSDVCVLPNLGRILALDISGLRIEGQLDSADTIRSVTRVYRDAIDRLKEGETIEVAQALARIGEATGRPLSDGPFDFRSASRFTKEKKLAQT